MSFTYLNTKRETITYHDLDIVWTKEHKERLMRHLKQFDRYQRMIGKPINSKPYRDIRNIRDEYIASGEKGMITYKGTFQLRAYQPDELYESIVTIYKVPIEKYRQGQYVVTDGFGHIALPEHIRKIVIESRSVQLVVALTTNGEFKTYLITVTPSEYTALITPMVTVRWEYVRLLKRISHENPELVREEIAELDKILEPHRGANR